MADTEVTEFGHVSVERYPWHDRLWLMLVPQIDRLPHALLLHGRPGLGKQSFAFRLAQVFLCTNAQGGAACGECRGCQWFTAGTHPDLFFHKSFSKSVGVKAYGNRIFIVVTNMGSPSGFVSM